MSLVASDVSSGPEGAEAEAGLDSEKIEGKSLGRLAWTRFRQDKLGMISLGVVLLLIVAAIFAPIGSALGVLDPYTSETDLVQGPGSTPTKPFGGIDGSHWLGVEPATGRDLFSRLVLGLTLDFAIVIAAALLTVTLGTIIGIVAGYFGGRVDNALGRLMDLILAFPQLLMLLALSAVLVDRIAQITSTSGNTPRIIYLITIFAFFGWPYFARVVRGQVLSLREREFVDAARSLGARPAWVIFRELLPNLWAPILVYGTTVLPTYVAAEAALNYLGVGLQPPTPTVGNILSDSVSFAGSVPTYFFIPGVLLCIVVLSFNLVGDSLRDALDPKSSRS